MIIDQVLENYSSCSASELAYKILYNHGGRIFGHQSALEPFSTSWPVVTTQSHNVVLKRGEIALFTLEIILVQIYETFFGDGFRHNCE